MPSTKEGVAYFNIDLTFTQLFNFGITFGLGELGGQAGEILPASFLHVDTYPGNSPVYKFGTGLFVMLFFAWVLGYLVTAAEPALHVMGDQVQQAGIMT